MKLSAQSHASIASSLREAVDKYIADGERTVVTDIHLQPKQDSGELVIFNDDDEELSRTIIEEWVDYSEDDFYTIVERILRGEINALKDTGVLDKLAIMKPYSFVLVDEDRETVTELLLIDDEDTLLLNDESGERVGKLNKAIKKLDAEERALISLFYNEEKTIGEIALILGLTESNAKVKLHRIRKKLYILITEAE